MFVQKTGSITYNGHEVDEFYVRRTSAYISQTDDHVAELTVRECLDFGARCQGAEEGFAGKHTHTHIYASKHFSISLTIKFV